MRFPINTCVCGFDLSTAVPEAHIWVTDKGVTCGDCPGCGQSYGMIEEAPEPAPVVEPAPEPEPEPEPAPEPEPET